MSRRGRATIGVLVGVFLLFTVLGWVVDAWTDWLWFDEVKHTEVFSGVLTTRLMLFAVVGLGMAAFVGGNLYLAYRLRPLLRPHSPEQATLERYRLVLAPRIGTWIALAAALMGLFAGLSAQSRWGEWMLFNNAQSFGVKDPQFNVDIGFYVFEYPFWRYLLGLGFTAVVLSVIGAIAVHYVFGGVRMTGVGDRITTAARAHLTTLVALFVLLKAVAYVLDRRGMLLDFNEGTELYGAGYADVNALLTAKEILTYLSIIVAIAIVVFSNAMMRNLVWPGVALGLLGIAAVAIGGIYPWAVQTFTVNPTPRDKEAPYIERSIVATRQAYGLETVKTTPYAGRNPTPPQSLATDKTVVSNIRLLDPELVSQTYTQLQQVRGFYDFGSKLDIDRYTLSGQLQDYVVGMREVNYRELTDQQSNWLNRHTVFTHGYGLVAAPANRIVCAGQPYFVSGFLGTEQESEGQSCASSTEQISVSQPRIYYGELIGEESGDYAIVGQTDKKRNVEFDRPSTSGDQYYTYEGEGGVPLNSFARKLLYGAKYRSGNFLLSDAINDDSRLMYVREPRSRVQKVAPFLTLDGDPYPAVVKGRIVWIVDGYTTASTYPYAQRVNLAQETSDALTGVGTFALARKNVNYIRNSVKATVDAYDGTVTLYEFDDTDPVLKAWNAAFGGDLVTPRAEIPPELLDHFRYPADLFKVQRNLLARFHVTEPEQFFSGQDFWQVPNNPATPDEGLKQPPYYLLTQLPGQQSPRFQLTSAVAPNNRDNLAALISGSYVDGKPSLEVLELPDDTAIAGPVQVHQKMTNNQATPLNFLQSSAAGSQVLYGNLLSLPFADGMLYVEPVYLKRSQENAYPLMQRVLMSYGEYVVLANNVSEGIEQLIAAGKAGAPAQPPAQGQPPPATGQPPTAMSPEVAAASAKLNTAIDEVRAAQASGDPERYGRALKALFDAMAEFESASGGTAPPSPTPTSSPGG
ncbi:MAG TPA: UPF0182 family protein [Micromonosporaceae bacterium]|nr:UPF0182 family protein [Micromonosporaceae bacterium]